jgi:hypothetical protein
VLIALPVYMLFIRDSGDDGSSRSALLDAARDPATAGAVLTQSTGDPKQGIVVRFPAGWKGKLADGAVRVTAPNNTTVLSVSAKGNAGNARTLFAAALEGIGADLKGAKVTYVKNPDPIGGLPSAQALVTGTRGKAKINAVVAVARGKKSAYLVSLIGPQGSDESAIANLVIARGLTLKN